MEGGSSFLSRQIVLIQNSSVNSRRTCDCVVLTSFSFFSSSAFGKYSEHSTPLSREAEGEIKPGQQKGRWFFCRIQSEALA